jgi:hypothetical protein
MWYRPIWYRIATIGVYFLLSASGPRTSHPVFLLSALGVRPGHHRIIRYKDLARRCELTSCSLCPPWAGLFKWAFSLSWSIERIPGWYIDKYSFFVSHQDKYLSQGCATHPAILPLLLNRWVVKPTVLQRSQPPTPGVAYFRPICVSNLCLFPIYMSKDVIPCRPYINSRISRTSNVVEVQWCQPPSFRMS